MKFLTLLKKELRDSLPWILLSLVLLLAIGWFAISTQIPGQGSWFQAKLQSDKMIEIFQLDIMHGATSVILNISLGLGLVLGIVQFWIPGFSRTWQYLIHRSVRKSTIITAKLTSVIIIMSLLSLEWVLLAGYTHISKEIIIPADAGMVYLGIFYGYFGLLVYLGTAICAITKAHWYTTKMLGLAFALFMILIIIYLANFIQAFIAFIIVFIILALQVYQTFSQREF
jgi:hypothetical protein